MKQTLREASREDFNLRGTGRAVSSDEIRNGCLQRIADAVEQMEKQGREEIYVRDRQIKALLKALRGVITKMKKAAK